MNRNIYLFISLSILTIFYFVINFIKIKRCILIHRNINNETNKEDYYYNKIIIVKYLYFTAFLIGICLTIVMFFCCDIEIIYHFKISYTLIIFAFTIFILLLIVSYFKIIKNILKVTQKYNLIANKKIINSLYNYESIIMWLPYTFLSLNILLTNYICNEIIFFNKSIIIFLYCCFILLSNFIFAFIKSLKTEGNWFKYLKIILKLFTKKPEFLFLGEKPTQPSVHLCNHVGSKGPLRLELYYDHRFSFWGTHEMNDGIKSIYKYLSTIYFQNKKHFKPFIAKIIAFIATPFLKLIYLGLKLIPTYPDMRLKKTIRLSLEKIDNNISIIIFPENSSNGYFDEIIEFEQGFVLLIEKIYKKGLDLPLYVMYYQKEKNRYVVDKSVMISELMQLNVSKEVIAEKLKNRCNELSKH